MEKELANLNSLSAEQVEAWFQGFAQIQLSSKLEEFDWINSPAQFVEQLSSHLWTTHQLDAFRTAAMEYANRLQARSRQSRLRYPGLELRLSARELRLTTKPCFASCARMAHISNGSSRKMVCSNCSAPSPPGPKRIP